MQIFTFHWFFLDGQVPYSFGFFSPDQYYVVPREMFGYWFLKLSIHFPKIWEHSDQRELWIRREFLQSEIQCEVRFRNLIQIYLSSFFWNVYVERCTEQDTTEYIKL